MPRKASLQPKTRRVNIKRSNGDTYVYERITKYNPEKQYNEVISSHLIGKIPAGRDEIVPTRKRRKSPPSLSAASVKRAGVTDILEWIGRESGIDQDLFRSTDRATAEKILSIARYWTANPGRTLPYMEEWQISHEVPYAGGISQDVCYALMKTAGMDEDLRQRFFHARACHSPSKASIAFDSTTVSSYSENQPAARYGYNKSGDGLKTIKLLTQYCLETGQPIAYAKQPGNIPDVVSVINANRQLGILGMEKPMLVMDAGFFSEDNLAFLAHSHVKFLTAGKTGASWIRPELEKAMGSFQQVSSICPFDTRIYGITAAVRHSFQRIRERSRGGISKGECVEEEHRLYLHLFLNKAEAESQTASLADEIRRTGERLKAGVEPHSLGGLKTAEKYLTVRNTRGGLHVSYNEAAFQDAVRSAGCFVLVSNAPMDCFEALRKYRCREKIEEHFRLDKQYVDGSRTRAWYPESLNGRFFCQFIALCYHEYLHQAITDLKKGLAVKNGAPEHDSQKNLKEEKALLDWLNDMSIERLFAWFDCIEETKVNTNMGQRRWRTETINRDRLFLKKLGVIKA